MFETKLNHKLFLIQVVGLF